MKDSLGFDPEESPSLSSQVRASPSEEVSILGRARGGTWQEMLDWEAGSKF